LRSAYDVCIVVLCLSSSALQQRREHSSEFGDNVGPRLQESSGIRPSCGLGLGAPQLLREIVIYLFVIPIVLPLLGIIGILLISLPLCFDDEICTQ
jgi:hypothetical protein